MASQADIQQHIQMVEALILRGHRRADIIRMVAEQTGRSPRQVERYYQRAQEQIHEGGLKPSELRLILLSRAELVYRESLTNNEYGMALKALNTQTRLLEGMRHDARDTERPGPDIGEALGDVFTDIAATGDADDT